MKKPLLILLIYCCMSAREGGLFCWGGGGIENVTGLFRGRWSVKI